MKEKGTTIADLANRMDQGFKANDSKFDELTKTIDDLAASTAVGFDHMERKFDSVDKQFNSIDKRFDSVDKRFDQTDKKIEDEIRSVKIEISAGLQEIKEEIERLDTRIDRLLKQSTDDVMVLIEEQEKIKLRLKKLELKNSQA